MTKTLDSLHQEHHLISRLLDVLEEQVRLLEQSEQADTRLIADIAEYIMNYPDIYHHPKEDLIFEVLRYKDSKIVPIINQLIIGHKTMTEMAIMLSELIAGPDKRSQTGLLVDLLHRYIEFSRSHMDIEEKEIFPRAREVLTDDDWTQIDTGFNYQGDPLFGDVIQKQYQHIYDSIIK